MQPLFASFPIEAVLGISIPFVAGVILGLTGIITNHLRKLQRDDMEATLKMEMLERGMSAEDIERVLAARMGDDARRHNHGHGHQNPRHQHAQQEHPTR